MDENKLRQQILSGRGQDISCAAAFAVLTTITYWMFRSYFDLTQAIFIGGICIFLIVLAFVTAVKGNNNG